MHFERSILQEVLPSLFISLVGLLLMSKAVYNNIENRAMHSFHYLFILNSMLCFKNNIELNYADIMSSTVRRLSLRHKHLSVLHILEYVFDCGAKMFVISTAASLIIGVCSGYANVFELLRMRDVAKNALTLLGCTLSSLFSGVCGSIATFACVAACITLSVAFDYNPDNIILPIIAALADYISTISLLYFTDNFYDLFSRMYPALLDPSEKLVGRTMRKIFTTNCALIAVVTVFLAVMHLTVSSRKTPSLFNVWSLAGAFLVTMVSGYLINVISEKNTALGSMVPLFNGLAGSVALIYTGQITSYANGSSTLDPIAMSLDSGEEDAQKELEDPRSWKTLLTLLVIAALLSTASGLAIVWLFADVPYTYIVVLCCLLLLEVALLYNLVNLFVAVLGLFHMGVSCHVVPLLNASSDLLGAIVIGAASIVLPPFSRK